VAASNTLATTRASNGSAKRFLTPLPFAVNRRFCARKSARGRAKSAEDLRKDIPRPGRLLPGRASFQSTVLRAQMAPRGVKVDTPPAVCAAGSESEALWQPNSVWYPKTPAE